MSWTCFFLPPLRLTDGPTMAATIRLRSSQADRLTGGCVLWSSVGYDTWVEPFLVSCTQIVRYKCGVVDVLYVHHVCAMSRVDMLPGKTPAAAERLVAVPQIGRRPPHPQTWFQVVSFQLGDSRLAAKSSPLSIHHALRASVVSKPCPPIASQLSTLSCTHPLCSMVSRPRINQSARPRSPLANTMLSSAASL